MQQLDYIYQDFLYLNKNAKTYPDFAKSYIEYVFFNTFLVKPHTIKRYIH
jgi:hypothetical protein